jgi:shikimate kinase
MKTSIALVGFMATGKTTIGKLLAQKLGKDFIDVDELIIKKAGKSIPAIFRDDGEIHFRELEIEVTRELAGRKNAVIACGGGAVLNKINIDRLELECVIVCLAAAPSVIIKRTSGGQERPLLTVKGQVSQVAELLKYRRPYYERAADIMINTSHLGAEAAARKILKKVKENENFGQ